MSKIQQNENSAISNVIDFPRSDVIRRLRARAQPILLFGESELEALQRLQKLELEQPDMKEGWKNDFQSALSQVDDEIVDQVIKGKRDEIGKHDVLMPEASETANWDNIVVSFYSYC